MGRTVTNGAVSLQVKIRLFKINWKYKKHWYNFLLFVQLGYDPNTPDQFFKDAIKEHFVVDGAQANAMSYMGYYYADRIAGATYKHLGNQAQAKSYLESSYNNYSKVAEISSAQYYDQELARLGSYDGWNAQLSDVKNEVISNGGMVDTDSTCFLTTTAANGSIALNPKGPYYSAGTVVALTTTANIGYTFTGWSGDLSGSANPTTITLNGNKNVTANFEVSRDVTALTNWTSGTANDKVSGSNRLMTVMVMGESSGNFSATGVTYGGQAMTKQTEKIFYVSGNRSYASIFTLNEAGVNAASNGMIAVSWSPTPSVGSSIYSVLLGNVDQTTPVSATANNALSGTTVTTSALSAASGDMIIAAGATENDGSITFKAGVWRDWSMNNNPPDTIRSPGMRRTRNGNKVSSGMYVYRLQANDRVQMKKFILLQ